MATEIVKSWIYNDVKLTKVKPTNFNILYKVLF